MKKIIIFIFLLLFCFTAYGTEEIKIRKKQALEEANHDYCVQLLQIALDNTEKKYGKAIIKTVNLELTQGRSLEELAKGNYIDIDWAGTDIKREEELLPIRVPLFAGLLGYRVLVIRKSDKSKFDKINNVNDLKNLIVLQGTHWPDSDILEASGFNVFRVPKFENMYSMLENKRVDYFLRSISEAYGEVKARKNSGLMVYDRIIVAYKFPMYFFVNKSNKKLAKRVEEGLRIAIDSGQFLKFMKSNSLTAPVFPLEKYKNSLFFEIKNPFLPKKTPINEKKLWIDFK